MGLSWVGQWPIFFYNFHENVEALRHVVSTLDRLLQEEN
jgi:hypothetical protein